MGVCGSKLTTQGTCYASKVSLSFQKSNSKSKTEENSAAPQWPQDQQRNQLFSAGWIRRIKNAFKDVTRGEGILPQKKSSNTAIYIPVFHRKAFRIFPNPTGQSHFKYKGLSLVKKKINKKLRNHFMPK